jgi:dolichol-phosphate mannosyltransferase
MVVDPSTTVILPSADDPMTTMSGGDARDITLTVVVPTRNESGNIRPLLSRLGPALLPLRAEIVFVDDSTDDTPEVVAALADSCPVPVRLLHREPAARTGGLAGAVVAGTRLARGEWVLVMDGDLQHPPEAAIGVAAAAVRHDVDIVIGTRYAGTGSGEGLSGAGRAITSTSATTLAKTLFPRRLATVSDPMSGLFAFRRGVVDVDSLNPIGFKILLEILVRHPGARVAEVAYAMAPRHTGTSKASAREGLLFLRHLARLRGRRLIGQLRERPVGPTDWANQLRRMVAFGLVGLSGVVVNTAAMWALYTEVNGHYLVCAAIATQASTAWNFLLIENLVYRKGGQGTLVGRGVRFAAMNNALLLARLPALHLLVVVGIPVLTSNAITLVALFLLRFLLSDRVIYGPASGAVVAERRDPVRLLVDLTVPVPVPAPTRRRTAYLTYRYDVAGVVTIGSQIVLPELEFFRAQWIADDELDITVRVGDVGPRRPRGRAAMTEYANPAARTTVRYEEHLGRFGANFRVELGQPIDIVVGPLLARSPHVVYTNVIEALLRFVMVSRGHMLLHSACVSLNGVGVMLSALTDTGKTATVLRLLRDHSGQFLSDDMTLIDAQGNAICFPKPLTISSHTLRAVRANELTPGEWRRLRLQSRLHSKGGRSFALALSRFNVPIMGINAITQRLIPPPKYTVDRLVPCRIESSTHIDELFIIERGSPDIRELDPSTTLERMINNTDDAYGFPPFRYLAPSISIDGLDYQQLRQREREILAAFLGHVRARCVASDTYGWADEIARLIRPDLTELDVVGLRRVRQEVRSWPRWGTPVAAPWGAG